MLTFRKITLASIPKIIIDSSSPTYECCHLEENMIASISDNFFFAFQKTITASSNEIRIADISENYMC